MSWAFACALCFVYAELVVLGVKSGWLLQVASSPTLIPLGLKGACSKWLPASWVLISAMHDGFLHQVMYNSELALWGLKVALSILSGIPCRVSTMPGRKKQKTHTNTCKARNKEPSPPHTYTYVHKDIKDKHSS